MDEAPKKGNPALSIDRAAFLLLRVKKAFKKKRQQRKEKQAAQQAAAAALASQTRAYRKSGPPPLLRSRTLPAIVVPGISILQAQIDPNRLSTGDALSNIPTSYNARYSLQPKSSRASLTSDDSTLEYRRKSSGSTHSGPAISNNNNNNTEPYIYAYDDFERHPDGTVVLRIPAPHVVAARAYRMSSSSSSTGSSGYFFQQPSSSTAVTGNDNFPTSTSSSNTTNNTALYRLARLLNQTTKNTDRQSPTLKDDAPRRLSWERRDHLNNRIPRSSSIDSMVEAVWNDSPRPSLDVPRETTTLQQSISQHYMQQPQHQNIQQSYQLNVNYGSFSGSFISRRESLLSPASGRRTKQNRGIAEITLPDLITRTPTTITPSQATNSNSNTNSNPCTPIQSPTNTKSNIKSFPLLSSKTTTSSSFSLLSPTKTVSYQNASIPEEIIAKTTESSTTITTTPSTKFVNFKLKSPLFRQNFKNPTTSLSSSSIPSSSSSSSSSSLSLHSLPNDMEFLVPQLPATKHQQQQQQQQQQHHHNHHLQQGHNNSSNDNNQNGKIILNQNNGILLQLPHQLQLRQHTNKMTKKQLKLAQAQLDKLTQINIHLHALFSAVEHGHLDKARTILESTDVDVNSLNSDGLSPLDVAVLSNNRSMTKMLLQHGALEGTQFKSPESLGNHLNGLLHDAENRVHDLSGSDDVSQLPFSTRASFSSIIGNSGPSVTGCTGTEADKQLGLWERRVKGLRRMLLGWDQARPPDVPSAVTVDVSGLNSVTICILEPMEGSIGTKFKVQWSTKADFSNIVGEREILEWASYQGIMGATCRISELTQGRRYFFRANCGNIKGWGPYRISVPTSVVPSSWRDMDNREHRFAGRQRILDDLFTAVRLARPEDASEISLEIPTIQRRNPKKKTTIKQLFSAASKFQKNLRRGIYLACVLYYEDKILVTNEDFLPVIEIDETYPSSLHADYHWFMKVACTWDDVKSLRTDMERNSASAVHFRTKLLSAACQMQSTLCLTDLGQLYHKPLRDSHGTVVLSCVNSVKSPKNISVLNSRWVPINKIQKKITALHEDNKINEILISSIGEQMNYHQTSTIKLSRGLYLGYLKMQSSVDQIQVVVPAKTPNVLPHSKIRENPHISAEEWEILKRDKPMQTLEFRPKKDGYTEVQHLFLEALTSATHRLFTYMNITPEDALTHRLYDVEVIELSCDVSFLIICPPVESSCAVPGQREILFQRGDLLSLPIQAFEMVHLRTYQNSIIQKYSRLSCILELDTALANHSHREAFSTLELQTAKERLSKLQELTSNLNAVWKGVRWLMDVIAFARDRGSVSGISMKEILEYNCNREDITEEDCCNTSSKLQLLQLPQRDNKLIKSSPGRGSWPGPAANNMNSSCFLGAEHSKSEQNLGCSSLTSRYLSANSEADCSSRKNSADSNCSQSGSYFSAGEGSEPILPRLPPSRSEDTLVVSKKYPPTMHRKRATTVNLNASSSSSPHLNVKTNYQNTTESLQSLSSDSESASYPLMTSTPSKSKKEERRKSNYLKPTLTALQSEIKLFKEPLHISEPSSPKTFTIVSSDKLRRTSVRQSSDEEDIAAGLGSSSGTGNTATGNSMINQQPGIIQVYAAYETGLASGTSLKLHVTPKTSAREVVDLVVKQLNMAVVLKGKDGPIYTPDKLENFCLVAVIGARERCLRDDFKPLQLQNPWKKGRLYVRQKHDLLAAIEHSNREAQLI